MKRFLFLRIILILSLSVALVFFECLVGFGGEVSTNTLNVVVGVRTKKLGHQIKDERNPQKDKQVFVF